MVQHGGLSMAAAHWGLTGTDPDCGTLEYGIQAIKPPILAFPYK